MLHRRHLTIATLTVALLAGTGACGGDGDAQADPEPGPSHSSSTTSPSPTDDPAGGPPEGWEDEFTEEQIRTYELALARWERYNQLTEPIYRVGKDTPKAREILREYSTFAQRDIVELAEVYDQGGVREEVPPEPLWTYARSVKPTYVVIVECTDYSDIRYTTNGDVLDNKPENLVTPLVVRMGKPEGRDWMFESSTLKDEASCAA